MLGRQMDPKAFLRRVGSELDKIDPAEVKTLADWIWNVYQTGRFVSANARPLVKQFPT